MRDRELQESAPLQDPAGFPQRQVRVRHVHQAHEGRGEVEPRVAEREPLRARLRIADALRRTVLLRPRIADECGATSMPRMRTPRGATRRVL